MLLPSWSGLSELEYAQYLFEGCQILVTDSEFVIWMFDDKRHRLDGPAVIWADGTKEWWVDHKRHRLDGPAFIWADGIQQWWVDDKLHRTDGPAVIWADGTKEWWVDGKRYSESEFNDYIKTQQLV
jgi:hypothetical protein